MERQIQDVWGSQHGLLSLSWIVTNNETGLLDSSLTIRVAEKRFIHRRDLISDLR